MRAVLLSVIASVGLVACVGQLDGTGGGNTIGSGTNPTPNPGGQAQKMFESNVYPIIHSPGAVSDCSSCHDSKGPAGNVTGFVAGNLGDAYATITSFQAVVGNFTPAAAGIITQVHSGHQGRMYTAEQEQKINDWLAQEVKERAGGGTTGGTETPAQVTARLLNQWTACMTLANWQKNNMTTEWGNMQTNNGSACRSCHATGGQGMMISNVEETIANGPPGMWTIVSTHEAYLVQYFSVDVTAATPKVIVNMTSFQGVATGTPPHAEHPRFDPVNNPGMTALNAFYSDTAMGLGSCQASGTKLNPPAM